MTLRNWPQGLFALALACGATGAQAKDEYITDVMKRDKKIAPLWRSIVPKQFDEFAWIKKLEGVTIPLERPTLQGKQFYLASVCKPHDCGGNVVAFLIAVDDSKAYGLMTSDILGVKRQAFGDPPPEAIKLLELYIAE